jgi:hypothetical protein
LGLGDLGFNLSWVDGGDNRPLRNNVALAIIDLAQNTGDPKSQINFALASECAGCDNFLTATQSTGARNLNNDFFSACFALSRRRGVALSFRLIRSRRTTGGQSNAKDNG